MTDLVSIALRLYRRTPCYNNYSIEDDFIRYLNNEFESELDMGKTFIRSSIYSSCECLDQSKLSKNGLNMFSGLVLKKKDYDIGLGQPVYLNNLKYEIVFHFYKSNSLDKKNLGNFFNNYLKNFGDISMKTVESKTFLYDLKNNQLLVEINEDEIEIICIIDASGLSAFIFNLEDERILYSNDTRIYSKNQSSLLSTKWKINQFSIENTKWVHDLSFWCENSIFSTTKFCDTIREVCSDLVKSVELIDIYQEKKDNVLKPYRHARCYRLVYQSCDRSLTHNATNQIQYVLRDKLVIRNNIELR